MSARRGRRRGFERAWYGAPRLRAGIALGTVPAVYSRAPTRDPEVPVPKLRIRIEFDGQHTLGPGKIRLLEAVDEHGSISAAARSMQMSYRHAWEMLDDINQCFAEPAILTEAGGRAGGGTQVTDFGRELVARYRAIQDKARKALAGDLEALARDCAPPPPAA